MNLAQMGVSALGSDVFIALPDSEVLVCVSMQFAIKVSEASLYRFLGYVPFGPLGAAHMPC